MRTTDAKSSPQERAQEPFLTGDRILEAAVEVLRRYGPDKATVLDVARALGVSHGSVYRHFASKAALRETVVRRWLDATMPPLAAIANENGPATDRLKRWLDRLVATKRERASSDPELFTAYLTLAGEVDGVVRSHMQELREQLAHIVADGVEQGELASDDPLSTARDILNATVRFHNPVHAASWTDPERDAAYEGVWRLVLRGIAVPRPRPEER
jgi:AcrR family transcriptional regulator